MEQKLLALILLIKYFNLPGLQNKASSPINKHNNSLVKPYLSLRGCSSIKAQIYKFTKSNRKQNAKKTITTRQGSELVRSHQQTSKLCASHVEFCFLYPKLK